MKTLRILGTRGVPAAHGGFETFAERLALYLVQRGWKVVVYCQQEGDTAPHEDQWQGVDRVHVAVKGDGPRSTVQFDWLATRHAAARGELCLTLGYNTAVFCSLLRLRGVPNVINMDGIEWARAKWGGVAKAWFWLNDWAGCWLGDHLVADHPSIERHLLTRTHQDKISMIPYGADEVLAAPLEPVIERGLLPGQYLTLVARPEPENSILEVVTGFSAQRRGVKLLVLGQYDKANAYHSEVMSAASDEVVFAGAIYDRATLQALRFHCLAYVHGHQVGGTNPSLVEALGAGNPVIAHDNQFNRWVAGNGARYFTSSSSCADILGYLLSDLPALSELAQHSRRRFQAFFTWDQVLAEYALLLDRQLRNYR